MTQVMLIFGLMSNGASYKRKDNNCIKEKWYVLLESLCFKLKIDGQSINKYWTHSLRYWLTTII